MLLILSKKKGNTNKMRLATFDHIIPKVDGGSNRIENGVCACRKCNSVRGSMSFERWKTIATSPKAVLAYVHTKRRRSKRIRLIKNTLKVHRMLKKIFRYYTRGYYKNEKVEFVPYVFH